MLKRSLFLLGTVVLAFSGRAASPLIISEFLANNNTSISDEDSDREDWIEIQNISTTNVNLAGWYLTDATNNLRRWQFPSTNVPPNGQLLVFASNKNRRTAGAPLHTNFRLSDDGEYLALVEPDGLTIATEFRPAFPLQASDVSYGFATDARDVMLVDTGSVARALVPTNAALGLLWTENVFNDQGWLTGTVGVGYDRNVSGVDYNPLIGLNVEAQSYNVNQSVYVRVPFVLTNVAEIDTLTLSLRFEDGMIAYLNGQKIVEDNAGTSPTYNSGAPANRADGTAITPATYNMTALRNFLQVGTNTLAFHVLNNGVASSDLLLFPQLSARTKPSGLLTLRYFPTPTPGAPNNSGVAVLGPIISSVEHTPTLPQTNEAVTVTARVRQAFAPVDSVRLRYRVMYTPEVDLQMFDDGLHGDGAASDGVYGASIPAGAAGLGQMIRWYIHATDTSNAVSRLPSFSEPLRSPEYFGTVVPVAQTNNLEILHMFVQTPSQADNAAGTRASLFFNGEFYDNVGINLHGQSSAGFPKKSYDIDFHRGFNFRWDSNERRVDDINLLTIYPDKAHMRNILAYETFRDAGTPYHFVKPVRIHQNGTFFSDAHIVENGDDNYLERLGMDINGALYKMYNTLNVAEGEKKTRQHEGTADLQALINGSLLPAGPLRNAYLFDNLNLPEVISYLAAQTITGNTDCCHKNYYLYRDTEGTGEWQILPWDVDLSFGRVWSSPTTYWDDVLYPTTPLFIGNNNTLMSAIFNTPELRQMYLRRLRTLMEELLQPPGTPTSEGRYEQRINELVALIAPDAALDLAKWGTWCCSGAGPYTQATIPNQSSYQSLAQAADLIKNQYLPARRNFLFNQQTVGNGGEIPQTQPVNTTILISSVEYAPASSNQLQEYIQLRNTNSYAVDMSGWRISGGVDFVFPRGTVMASNSYLYVTPDVRAFRARTSGPRGNQGLYALGGYSGQLSARGETVRLEDRTSRVVASVTYPGTPSLPQQYLRITELMYHPSPLAGNTNAADEFQYVELKNIGPVAIDLSGVRFVNGISFNFTGSAVETLEPGARVLVVRNPAQFAARYGNGHTIAGAYTGSLANNGERVQLVDAIGEEILDFSYNNSWYPITDGLGFSLVIVDELASPDAWNTKANWRASGSSTGSPGQSDPPQPTFAPIVINEALTRTAGVPDAIELHNPNTNTVDISGWFLTDDFNTPRKFRIPDGTIIEPGAFRVFTESNFNANPALATSFALGSDGDEVFVFGAELSGNLTGYYHGFEFGAAEEGVSFGRHFTSDGREHFVRQNAVTLSASNAGPRVGPIVISEIMYHPVAGSGTNNYEFLELLNVSDQPVALFDTSRPTNTWALSGGISFQFPTNVTLAAGEAVIVAGISPANAGALAAFRAAYNIAPSVQVFGAWSGTLNNDGATVTLLRPTAPLPGNPPVFPYPIVDSVRFTDELPWPKAADGFGLSLQRWNPLEFGHEPANWTTTGPSAGQATATNGTPPLITGHPQSQLVLTGETATVSVTASGTPPLTYQWSLNGTNLPGATNASILFSSVQLHNAGEYEAIVYNPFGAVFSLKGTLDVRMPVQILQQPATVDVRVPPDPAAAPSTNITFNVVATSTSPIRYQWRRNDQDIVGETNSSLTIVGVQTNDLAYFSVVVSDALSTRETTNFWLYPLISPQFVEQPLGHSVPVGGRVTLSTMVSGWPPPFTFEWRLGAATLQSGLSDQPYSFYSFNAAATPGTVSYRAIVRNRALPSGRASGFAAITTLADADADGIPDEWENRYGFNPGSNVDQLVDADGDGMANLHEYLAGTDPTNALSVLKLTSNVLSNGVVNVEFPAMSNRTYAVQHSADLAPTNWTTVTPVMAGRSNRTHRITESLGETNRFFRVITPAE